MGANLWWAAADQNLHTPMRLRRPAMQMIIEARLVDDLGETEPVRLAVIERELTTSPVGVSLAEGKAILAAAQRFFVDGQCQGIAAAHSVCEHCDRPLSVKGWHQRQVRTVFGRVTVRSPRVRVCACENKRPGASFSPMTLVVPTRVTPELEYLQVKWAAHLPCSGDRPSNHGGC